MTKTAALPRYLGAAALSLFAIALVALVLPALSLAAPAEGAIPQLTLSPSPATLPTTTVGNQSQSREFVVTNNGEADGYIEKAYLGGEDAGEFNFAGNNCSGAYLQPGQQCSVWIDFMPGNSGERYAVIDFQLMGLPDQTAELSAIGALPSFSFNPGSYEFGLQPIHNETARTTFQLENDGEAAAQVNSLNITGANTNGFWIGNSNCYGSWLEPGQSCSVEVEFGPSETGPRTVQLEAYSNGQSFDAEISGEGGRAIVEATPNPADFAATTVGSTSATQTIVIANSGNVPTGFFIGIVAGGDAGSFQLLDENCTFVPLMPAGSCTAHLRFRPQSAGVKTAHLAFFGEGEGGTMVALGGEGVEPAVTLVPSEFDFGTAVAGTKSGAHSFAVRNEGSTSLGLGSVAIVGADLDQFALSGDECTGASLAPGAECLVRARFVPDSAGAKSATLRIGSDAGAFTAALTGLGSAASAATQPPIQIQIQTGQSQPPPPGAPAPGRHRGHRHHRFAQGDAVITAAGRRPARSDVRTGVVPR
jgi:hypothetical protein